jgi:hypothetical protein
VSDFVSRVAARAVGQAALGRPRVPALFERAEPGTGGLEIVESEVGGRPSASDGAGRSVDPDSARIAAPARSGLPPSPLTEPEAPKRGVLAPREPGARPERPPTLPAEPSRVREIVPGLAHPTMRAGAPDAPTTPATRPSLFPPSLFSGPVPVTPASPAAVAPAAERATAAPRGAAPAVRVHIGRLEVRANLHDVPATRPVRERPQSQELALGDYLRGKRDAR